MENFEIVEIIGKDNSPKIGNSTSKKPLLTVFKNGIVFNKAAENLFGLSINSKMLIVTGNNDKKYICLDCGEYTVDFALENSLKQITFVLGTETATKSVTDGLTGKTHSLVFHELTLLET
jgi:hypothetical protein